jgi:hypothetical protein
MEQRTTARATPAIYGGLFFTTLSTLMYEVLLTRIFSVTMWYHFAFVAVSVALFGMTVGALIIHLLPERFRRENTRDRLAQASLLFSITVVVSFLTQLAIPFDAHWSLNAIYSTALIYLVISVPFIFSGVTVALTLTRFPDQVSRLYAVDLVGAGLGTVTLVSLLNVLGDGPSAVVVVAALAAVGACLFAIGAGRSRLLGMAAAVAVLWTIGGFANAIAAQHHHPVLRVHWAKNGPERTAPYERWNALSRIRIVGDQKGLTAPAGWGFSPTLPPALRTRQLVMSIDTTALTYLPQFDGNLQNVDYLRYDVVNVAHYLRNNARVFIIGSGGGRDVLTALVFHQPSVTAVEMNGAILDAVNGQYGDFTGHLDKRPGVHFVNDEARSYLTRSDDRYNIIQISLIDTWAATAAGAFALAENSLYTEEAWNTFLEHLAPDGVLTVSRWFQLAAPPVESYRLTALAAKALRDQGISNPRDHMILIRNPDSFPPPWFPGGQLAVANMLVSKEPFSPQDIERIQQVAKDLQFEILLAPEPVKSDPVFAAIAEAKDPNSVPLGSAGDISPPTDDKPFFFQMIRYQDIFDSSLYGGAENRAQPVLVLFMLAIAMLVLTASCILLPLVVTTSRRTLQGMTPFVVFFCGIGLGFLLIEIAQLQRLTIFLGHPTYALSVVLFSLLIFSGIGSLLTERLVNPGLRPALLLPFAVLLGVLIAAGIATPGITHSYDGATTPVRIFTATAMLAPIGLLMGMPFPIGMKLASLRENAPTAFFWGANGATSVLASVLGVAIALQWGISIAFWVGVACYAVAALALGRLVARGRV